MPINPAIIGQIGAMQPQMPTPLSKIAEEGDRLEAAKQKRDAIIQQAKDTAAIQAAMGAHKSPDGSVDYDGLLSDLADKISPSSFQGLQKTIDDHRDKISLTVERDLKNKKAKYDFLLPLSGLVKDQDSLDTFRQAAGAIDPEVAKFIPQTFDEQTPKALEQVNTISMTGKERADAQHQALLGWIEAQKLERGTPAYLQAARGVIAQNLKDEDPQNWPTVMKSLVDAGLPKSEVDKFIGKTPEQAAQMALTPEKQAELAGQQATRDQQKAYQDAELKIRQQEANTGTARENREGVAAKAVAGDVASDARTTLSGKKYIDLGDYETPTARAAARDAAKKAGLTVLDKTEGDAMQAADTAKLNIQAMWSQIKSKLPSDATGRILAGPENKLEKFFQSDPDLAAFNSWRAGAIQAVQALVERGMGFRLNQAEINMIMQNDMPQITDTISTAERRVKNVLKLLQDKEDVIMTRDRSTLGSGGGAKEGDIKPLTGPGYPPDAQQQFKNGQWVRIK